MQVCSTQASTLPTDWCKVGSDYTPDAAIAYDCDAKMSESDCKAKGGDTHEGERLLVDLGSQACAFCARWPGRQCMYE